MRILPLNEMVMSRSDAIDRCTELGKKFIEHFCKIFNEPDNEAVNHWLTEMQSWYDKVKDIKLKSTSRCLLNQQICDWFFTCGETSRDIIPDISDECEEAYDKFCTYLLIYNNCYNAWEIINN